MQLSGTFWAWVPAGLLTAMLAGLFSMAVIANRDPGFALERDYYAKAVHYDREIAQRSENARLDWSVSTEVAPIAAGGEAALVVRAATVGGPLGAARVRVEALRNASAARVLEATLVEQAAGTYRAELPLERGGLWEFRLTLERPGQRFTHVARLDVGGGE